MAVRLSHTPKMDCLSFLFMRLDIALGLGKTPGLYHQRSGNPHRRFQRDGLILSPGHGNRFTRRSWTEQWEHSTSSWPRAEGLDCYTSYCRLERAGQTFLIFAKTRKVLSEYCTKADVLVTPVVITPSQIATSCKKARLIDGNALHENGTHTVFLSEDGSEIESVRAHQGARLWNRPT